jgi:hypothetical protein
LGRGVGDAQTQVLDVVDGLVQEHRHVVVIQAVDDALAGPGAGDQAEVAQQAQLVGDRGLLHPDRLGQAGHRARRLAQPGQDQQPAGGGQGLQGDSDLRRCLGVQPRRGRLSLLIGGVTHGPSIAPGNT